MDFSHLLDYAWALSLGWVGYIHRELKEKPSKEELILRLELLKLQLDEMKDDIKEIKAKF